MRKSIIVATVLGSVIFGFKNDRGQSIDNLLNRDELISQAKTELALNKITSEQVKAKTYFSERAFLAIRPSVYEDNSYLEEQIKNFIIGKNRFTDSEKLSEQYSKLSKKLVEYHDTRDDANVKKYLKKIDKLDETMRMFSSEDDPYSEDAWRMYLGIPMKYNTFGISNHTPSNSKEQNKYYYTLPSEFENELLELFTKDQISEGIVKEFVFEPTFAENGSRARVLGNFKIGKGNDEKGEYISYYDIYDFSPNLPIIGETPLENFVGKPFEIYNRIYYDSKTEKRIK